MPFGAQVGEAVIVSLIFDLVISGTSSSRPASIALETLEAEVGTCPSPRMSVVLVHDQRR
jgi:hypothetical protein